MTETTTQSEVGTAPVDRVRHPGADRRFAVLLLAVVLLGFGVRLANTFVFTDYQLAGDAAYFHGQAAAVADGRGFVDPFLFGTSGRIEPSARHPPAFTVFLAAIDLLGVRGVDAQRFVAILLGCATIAVIGIVGRKLAGRTAGIVAAGISAVLPALVIADAQLLSEGLFGLAMALILLTAYRYRDETTLRRAAALSAAVALAALTRGEALLLYLLLVVPLIWSAGRDRAPAERWRAIGVAAAIAVLLIGPWVTYNTIRFSQVAYSTNSGAVVMLANCSTTYDRADPKSLGYWSGRCNRPNLPGDNEAEVDAEAMAEGVGYAASRPGGFVVVAAARVGRMLDLFKPAQTVLLDGQFEGRGIWQSELAMLAFFAAVAFAIPGLVILRRRGVAVYPLVSLGSLALLSAVVAYGNVRFRIPLDVALVIPAAVGIVAGARMLGCSGRAASVEH